MSRILNPPMIGAVLILLLTGAAALGWLWLRDSRITTNAIFVMLVPLGLLATCIFMDGNNRSQIAITAWAITMFGAMIPAYYVLESGPENWFLQWRFMLGYGLFYLVLLLWYILRVATWTAWVPSAPGVLPLSEHRLQQRIRSLADAGLDLKVERPGKEPNRMIVSRDFRGGKRRVGIRLTFTGESHCILAREVSLIRGDKPMNASEAQMYNGPRHHGEVHPDADLIYNASQTVTPADEAIREQIKLQITDDRVEIASGRDVAFAPANLAHLLTVLVHQSGWGWQGVFFDWQKSCN